MLLWCVVAIAFPTQLRWKHIVEITFIGKIFTKLLCGPRCFYWSIVLAQYIFFKISKRPLEGRRETVKFVRGLVCVLLVHRNLHVLECRRDRFKTVLNSIKVWFWRHLQYLQYCLTSWKLNCNEDMWTDTHLEVQKPIEVPIKIQSYTFCQNIWSLSPDPVSLNAIVPGHSPIFVVGVKQATFPLPSNVRRGDKARHSLGSLEVF